MKQKLTMLFISLVPGFAAPAQAPSGVPYGNPEPVEFTPGNIIIFVVIPLVIVFLYLQYRKKQREKEKK